MALTQLHYRWGADSGTNETDHGWLAPQDTPISVGSGGHVNVDTPFLLRVGAQNNALAVNNINFTVQYKINAGSWVTITTTSAAVKAVAAATLTNNGNTTQRLTGMSGTFQGATGQAEDGDAGGNSMDIASNGNAEVVYGLQVNSAGVSDGQTLTFQLLQEGLALAAYAVTPTLSITGPSGSASGSASASIEPGATFIVELRQGATLITSWPVTLTLSLQTFTHALTTGERDSITDWTALRYSFIADGDQAKVVWAELETPGALTQVGSPSGSASASESSSASGSTVDPVFEFELYCGATLIASVASYSLPLSETLETYEHTLTPDEFARVTDWGDLYYTFRADGRQVKVTWAELSANTDTASSPSQSGSPSGSASRSVSSSASGSTSGSESSSASLGTYSLTLQLYQGALLIVERDVPVTIDITTYVFDLNATEVESITNWGALEVRLIADGAQMSVSWVGLEAPVAASGGSGSASGSPSASASGSKSSSPSGSASGSASRSSSGSTSGSPSGSRSGSASGSASGSRSGSESASYSQSRSASGSASSSASGTPSGSASGSASGTPSGSESASYSESGSTSGSESASYSPSGSASGSKSGSPSGSASASWSALQSGSTSGSPSRSASGSASGSRSSSASGSASGSESGSASPSLEDFQRGLPVLDIAAGNWTNEADETTNLAASIGEAIRDDTTYIKSALVPNDDLCKIKLSEILTPDVGYAIMRVVGRWR